MCLIMGPGGCGQTGNCSTQAQAAQGPQARSYPIATASCIIQGWTYLQHAAGSSIAKPDGDDADRMWWSSECCTDLEMAVKLHDVT